MMKLVFLLFAAIAGLPGGCSYSTYSHLSLSDTSECSHICQQKDRITTAEPGYTALQLTAEKERFVYRRGENLRFGVSVARDSYVECFYRRADDVILKVYPNRFQQGGKLLAGMKATFPNPVFFSMEAGEAGEAGKNETLMCLGSAEKFDSRGINDFEGLSFSGLSDVVNHFRAHNDDELVVQTLVIEVRP